MLKTTIHEEGNLLIMTFEGKLDSAASFQTERDMKVLFDSTDHDYLLDMNQLRYVASSGLRLFLQLLKHARSHGRKVEVTGLSEFMQRVFDETGFTRLFSIVHSQGSSSSNA
jgi:anti-sigma B factor antagonist